MLGGMQTAGGLHEVHGRLRPAAPFDFDKSVAFVCGFAATEGEQAVAGAGLTKAFRVDGHTVLVDLARAWEPRPALSPHGPTASPDRPSVRSTTPRAVPPAG